MKGWISRAAHEEIVALYRQRAEQAEASRNAIDARHIAAYQDLLTRYQSLVERSASAAGVPTTVKPELVEPDLILEAAQQRWGSDPAAMPFVARFISDERAKAKRGEPDAMTEQAILEKVIFGVSGSEGIEL